MYKYAPDFCRGSSLKWRYAFIGSSFSTLACSIITILYSFYASNISNMSLIYGPLLGIFVLLVWLNLTTTIILAVAKMLNHFSFKV